MALENKREKKEAKYQTLLRVFTTSREHGLSCGSYIYEIAEAVDLY